MLQLLKWLFNANVGLSDSDLRECFEKRNMKQLLTMLHRLGKTKIILLVYLNIRTFHQHTLRYKHFK